MYGTTRNSKTRVDNCFGTGKIAKANAKAKSWLEEDVNV